MISAITYNTKTGEITAAYFGKHHSIPVGEDEEVLSVQNPMGVSQTEFYVDVATQELKPRSILPADVSKLEIVADGNDICQITNLPDPVEVKIDGVLHTITGGVLELVADVPATYKVEINHWPYLPWTVEIIANAPDTE